MNAAFVQATRHNAQGSSDSKDHSEDGAGESFLRNVNQYSKRLRSSRLITPANSQVRVKNLQELPKAKRSNIL